MVSELIKFSISFICIFDKSRPRSVDIDSMQEQPSLSSSESQLSSLREEELDSMLTTLYKFKHIAKKGQIAALKQKNKKTNTIFCQMSSFFHARKNQIQKKKALTKSQRVQLRQERLQSKINQSSIKNALKHLPQWKDTQTQQHKAQPSQEDEIYLRMICHVCKNKYEDVDPFYGYFCPPCAQLNTTKRTQKADFTGLTALVTGGRIKIGFQIVLRLLREGAQVYASSRFPQDTVLRYQSQEDYSTWSHRLHIVQCDFLSQAQVVNLISTIKQKVPKLDILINNAAQTIVRPRQFYTKEIQNQQLMLEDQEGHQQIDIIRQKDSLKYPSVYANHLAIKPEEIDLEQLDQFGQPTDKRVSNSWVQNIEDVPLVDCLTTQVVNSIVPFQLVSQLKDKMKGNTPSWIINVSSMEGVFDRPYKAPNHPHTNMAKAALNMLTRTSSQQLALDQIYMNSVDTGWVTNQNPFGVSQVMTKLHHFKCPLDCVDGAMRVLDPIYRGVISREYPYGLFLKNYSSSCW